VNVDTRAMPHSAPAGKAVVSGHWVDEYSKAAVGRSDEELLPEMIEHMESVIPGLSAELEFAEVVRWEIATNARYIGFYDTVSELRRSLDPDDVVQLAGDFLGISGTVTSVESGERAAAALRRQLRSLASR
jgi:oxygen-dependent protoporphyrinogen oxidase